jgi:hypothetical protein
MVKARRSSRYRPASRLSRWSCRPQPVAATRERHPWASQLRRRAIAAHCPARPGIDRRSSACRSMRPWSRGAERQEASAIGRDAASGPYGTGRWRTATGTSGHGSSDQAQKPRSRNQASTQGRPSMSLPTRCREPLPTRRRITRMGLTLRPTWEPSPPGASILLLAAVPPACHKQRSLAVSSGQPRSLREGHRAGRWSLTWTPSTARHCMACKRSLLGQG